MGKLRRYYESSWKKIAAVVNEFYMDYMSYLRINHLRERRICAASKSFSQEVLKPSRKKRFYLNGLKLIRKLASLHLGTSTFPFYLSDFVESLIEQGHSLI